MKTAIMFPGQGAQYPGMMQDIFEQYSAARDVFDAASEALKRDIYALSMCGTQDELNLTQNTQPCLLTCELAILRVFQSLGLEYDAAVGFSLGEWAALPAVGAATEQDVLRLIEKRATAMQDAVPEGKGGMAVILGQDAEAVQELCRSIGDVSPSNYNCPGNITVAGTAEAIDRLLKLEGSPAARVAVSVPSHCPLMQPAVERLRPDMQALPLGDPEKLFVMNATGLPAKGAMEIRENLLEQLIHPVRFQQSIEYLLGEGYDTFLEFGPGKTLSGMVKRTAKKAGKKVHTMQLNSIDHLAEVRQYFAG